MPPKLSSTAVAYLQFLRLTTAVKALPASPVVDANEEALLNELALQWYADKPLSVREAMLLESLGSPSTLHRRITRLKAMDLIENKNSPDNRLIKLLVPTQRALKYFGQLGAALRKSVES